MVRAWWGILIKFVSLYCSSSQRECYLVDSVYSLITLIYDQTYKFGLTLEYWKQYYHHHHSCCQWQKNQTPSSVPERIIAFLCRHAISSTLSLARAKRKNHKVMKQRGGEKLAGAEPEACLWLRQRHSLFPWNSVNGGEHLKIGLSGLSDVKKFTGLTFWISSISVLTEVSKCQINFLLQPD